MAFCKYLHWATLTHKNSNNIYVTHKNVDGILELLIIICGIAKMKFAIKSSPS